MRKIWIALALWCLLASSAAGGNLSAAESDALRTEVASMMASVENWDVDPLIARTHPSLPNFVGGLEAFEKITRQAVEQLRQTGVKFTSSEMGTPTQTYAAGDEEVCFVPRVSVIELQGKKIKSTTFMIAIRRIGGREWKYLDGSGLRKNPEILYQLLPQLERGISLPLNMIEPL